MNMRLQRVDGTPHLTIYKCRVHELGDGFEHQKSEEELFGKLKESRWPGRSCQGGVA
jgi:hypothetical protein